MTSHELAMSDRCINLTAHEVRGLLDGSVTQLRRVVNPQPGSERLHGEELRQDIPGNYWWGDPNGDGDPARGPFGSPGDRLIGRETWRPGHECDAEGYECSFPIDYKDGRTIWFDMFELGLYPHNDPDAIKAKLPRTPKRYEHHEAQKTWRFPATMPRWASRLPLRVKSVRVQQLGDVTIDDAKAEGIHEYEPPEGYPVTEERRDGFRNRSSVENLQALWSRNGMPLKELDPNPWTFVAEVEREEKT